MADDLAKLPDAIRLSRRALANIALSLAAIAVLVAGDLAGALTLMSGLLLTIAVEFGHGSRAGHLSPRCDVGGSGGLAAQR